MTKKSKPRKNQRARLWLALGGAIVIVVLGMGVWFAANTKPPARDANALDIAATLSNTETAFNVGTRVGQPASAFTLSDAQGKPYAFQPADGHKYMLAFNMGYV